MMLWDDAVIRLAELNLGDFRKVIAETVELIHRFELATASEQTWAEKREDLISDGLTIRFR